MTQPERLAAVDSRSVLNRVAMTIWLLDSAGFRTADPLQHFAAKAHVSGASRSLVCPGVASLGAFEALVVATATVLRVPGGTVCGRSPMVGE